KATKSSISKEIWSAPP
ncbi:hypothetical protein DBR06_SOUSAS12710010, partial [Sousa chinensis]